MPVPPAARALFSAICNLLFFVWMRVDSSFRQRLLGVQ